VRVPDADASDVPGAALGIQRLPDLERSLTRVALEAGEVLFREGDAGDSLYVVVAGRVRLLAGEPGAKRAIHDFGPGELVGESALLTGEPRTATVIAVRDTELYRLGAESAGRSLLADLSAMCRKMTTLARRPDGGPTGISAGRPSVRSVALAAAGDTPLADVARFGEVLGAFLSGHLRVAVLSPRTVEAAVGVGATACKDAAYRLAKRSGGPS
jgi:NTE family protein